MSKMLILKQRKHTINSIYRSSCAMKAAAAIKVRKSENMLSESEHTLSNIIQEYGLVLKKKFNAHVQDLEEKKLNLLIGCNKGFCGKFLSDINIYFEQMSKKNKHEWLLIGAKLESLANCKNIKYLCEVFEKEEEIFNLSMQVWQYINRESITHFSIHSFYKSKIKSNEILSKNKQVDYIEFQDHHMMIFFIAANLTQAIWQSMLEENKQRLIAVEQAKTNAESMAKYIERMYNRARQEKITFELNEITAGIV